MFNFSKNPLPLLKIVVETIKLYITTFTKMWYLFLIYCIATSYWTFGYTFNLIPSKSSINTSINNSSFPSKSFLIFLVVGVIISLISLYIKWTAIHRLYWIPTQPKLALKTSLQFINKKIVILFTNQIIVMAATLSLLITLVVPGIILAVFLIFCVPLILFSEEGIISSIKKSCILVWRNFWRTFLIASIPLIGMVPANLALNYLSQFGLHTKFLGILTVGSINGFIMTPILWAAILVLFNDLTIRKELTKSIA